MRELLGKITTTLLLLTLICHSGVAHADAGASPDVDWSLITHQGWILGSLLVANGLFRWFLKANDSQHWIAQGKTLAILTALFAVVGSVLDWKLNGGQATGVLTALFAGVSLVMHSTVKSPSSPTSTLTTLLLAVALGAVVTQPACSATTKQRLSDGFTTALNCEAPSLAGTFASMLPLAAAAVSSFITSDGKHIDKAKFKDAVAPLGDKDTHLKCALATALAVATTPVKADATAAAGLEVDPAVRSEAKAVLGELGWTPIITSAGTI